MDFVGNRKNAGRKYSNIILFFTNIFNINKNLIINIFIYNYIIKI